MQPNTTYTIYHMRRHVPPVGSIHITADVLGTVQAVTRAQALRLAQAQYAQLRPHIAIATLDNHV